MARASAREAAWRLAKSIPKLKEKDKTAFFSPSENRCLPATSTLKPEEREFVVDSGASMHMISKKDLNSGEMDTLTTSRCPTTVITANGEVQTHEEATVFTNSTPHTSLFSLSHNDAGGSRLKFGVRSAHFTSSHASSSCAHVVCLILRDSPFLFLLSIFSPIVLFIFLIFSFFFHDVEDMYPVHSR